MKQQYKYVIILLALLSVQQSKAQFITIAKGINSLKIGDMLPPVKITNIYNYSANSASTADFSDRLLIFDFGDIYCSGCVHALPHMDSLQQQFGDKVRIFWVTDDKRETIAAFWTHNKLTKNLKVPVVAEDSILGAYFRFTSWPHEAWVYKGKVIALTDADHVDAASIRQVLNGEQISWPVKDDFYVFDGSKTPLFTPDSNRADANRKAFKYAIISKYKPGVAEYGTNSGIVRDTNKKTVRAFFVNWPVYNIYMYCMNNQGIDEIMRIGRLTPNCIAWEVADKNKYIFTEGSGYRQDWTRDHSVCFESLNPDTGQTNKAVYLSAISDLNRLLGLKVFLEKRREKVLVLKRTDSIDRIKSKTKVVNEYEGPNLKEIIKGNLHQFRDFALVNLVWELNQQAGNPYVIDGTGYTGTVDMDLDIPAWSAIDAIKKALLPYGLTLQEEEKDIDVLVFKEEHQ